MFKNIVLLVFFHIFRKFITKMHIDYNSNFFFDLNILGMSLLLFELIKNQRKK